MKIRIPGLTAAGKILQFLFIFTAAAMALQSGAAENPSAKLAEFSGVVLIKNSGSWGVKPEIGLQLYSGDKVVTKTGRAVIKFSDGAVMKLSPNSNLLIQEQKEFTVRGAVKSVKRRLRLLIGKMSFKSGEGSSVKTDLETSTMVCGLRGTAGILSIDAAGQTYLTFTEGGGDTVGSFIAGEAADVPFEIARLHPAQRAAFVANLAALQAADAVRRLEAGEITDADAELAMVNALEAAALEAKAAAEAMLVNPDPAVHREVLDAINAADAAIEKAEKAKAALIESGAVTLGDSNRGPEEKFSGPDLPDKEDENIPITAPKELADIPQEIRDMTSPQIRIVSSPELLTRLSTASFELSSDEPAALLYSTDGVNYFPTDSTLIISDLSEGGHEIFVKGVDASNNESEIIKYKWTVDLTPPEISFDSGVADISNNAGINFSMSDANPGILVYQLDGDDPVTAGESVSIILPSDGSADGKHSIVITAYDAAGNKSDEYSRTWTHDTIAPVIAFKAVPDGEEKTRFEVSYENDEPGAVTITINGNETDSIENLADGIYTFTVVMTDEASNTATEAVTFSLENISTVLPVIDSSGSISGSVNTVTSAVTGQDWGTSKTGMSGSWSGTHSAGESFSLISGAGSLDSYYAVQKLSGVFDSPDTASGMSEYTYLSRYSVILGSGDFDISFDNTDYSWTGSGTGSSVETIPLDFSGYWTAMYSGYGSIVGTGSGISGFVLDESGYINYGLGKYYFFSDQPMIWYSVITDPDTEEVTAYSAGILDNGNSDMVFAGLYKQYDESGETLLSAGILYDSLMTFDYYSSGNNGIWESNGVTVPFETVSSIAVSDLTDLGGGAFSLSSGNNNSSGAAEGSGYLISKSLMVPGQKIYGIWFTEISGSYDTESSPSHGWGISLSEAGDSVSQVLIEAGSGSEDGLTEAASAWETSTGHLSAYTAGAWVNISESVTGILGGKIKGTFEPLEATLGRWQASGAGTLLDTTTFIALASTEEGRAQLEKLNIPCIEVGSTDLYTTMAGERLTDVTMADVKFFAYRAGASPRIWAAGDVTGTNSGDIRTGDSVVMTGDGFSSSVYFSMDQYNRESGTWNASISSEPGNISGYSENVELNGNAAGKIQDQGSFSGTASGVVSPSAADMK